MERRVGTELLDELAPEDPRAARSRRDLCRLNGWMGNAGTVAAALHDIFSRHLSYRLIDLGAGDGEFLLRVARRLQGRWRRVDALVLDRQNLLTETTRAQFTELKWQVGQAQGDVFEWLRNDPAERAEAMVANLFLHHFHDHQLRELFRAVAARATALIAVEPRRSPPTLFFSRLLWLIGCNSVTRHDAAVSVRAGFGGRELSALWPDGENWELVERPAGRFSHLFIARRKERTESTLWQPIVSAVFNRPAAATPAPADEPAGGAPPAPDPAGSETLPPRET
jgi:hypothetical protein